MTTKERKIAALDRLHDMIAIGMCECHEFNSEIGVWCATPEYYEELGECLFQITVLDVRLGIDPAKTLALFLPHIEHMGALRKPYAPSATEITTIQSV